MLCKRSCIRRIGACAACLMLIINLVCTSYTRVQAAEVATAYAIEEVVGALLASLGITAATGEALNKTGLTAEDARSILNSIYASAKEFSHDTDEAIDETIMGAIADATELGKITFKQGSKAWDALKAWAKTAYSNIKALSGSTSTTLSLSGTYPTAEEWDNIYKNVVSTYYGISASDVVVPRNDSKGFSCWFFDKDYMGVHYVAIVALGSQIAFFSVSEGVYSWGSAWADRFNRIFLENYLGSYGYDVMVDGTAVNRSESHSSLDGSITNEAAEPWENVKILWSNVCFPWQNVLGVPIPSIAQPLPWSDAYDMVYNPAIPDTTDIVTPSNTIAREKDGSVAVTGDRVIDVALPVAFPIDLTKGIVIGKDIPVEDVLDKTVTDDKTDEKTDEKEDTDKPATPDVPGAVADDLKADLKSIFPFCIPFDLINCIKGLSAEGEAPKWVIKIPMPTGYTWTITVDMADYESIVRIFRLGEDLLFIVGLIMITRSLMIRG